MINILPESGRVAVRRAYLVRLAAVTLFVLSGVGAIAAALLSPSYFDASVKRSAAEEEVARLNDRQQSAKAETEVPVEAAREYIVAYAPFITGNTPSVSIERVIRARGSGITLSRLVYERGSGVVSITGLAATREQLLAFERALKAAEGISNVALPISDLAKSVQAPFSMQITFTQ